MAQIEVDSYELILLVGATRTSLNGIILGCSSSTSRKDGLGLRSMCIETFSNLRVRCVGKSPINSEGYFKHCSDVQVIVTRSCSH
jgi:hypothetical protein